MMMGLKCLLLLLFAQALTFCRYILNVCEGREEERASMTMSGEVSMARDSRYIVTSHET